MQKKGKLQIHMTLANGHEEGTFDPSWLMGIP